MLPLEVVNRLFKQYDVLGLQMIVGSEKRVLYFQIETVEEPNDLADFSLGSATALSVAGTGWSEIQDSASRFVLEPEYENVVYHLFFGISPAPTWVYRRYPANRDINSLVGTRAIGSGQGHIDGLKSPYKSPSPLTEMFTAKGLHPAFLGYNPYAVPSSITVRLYFYITRYDVVFKGVDPSGGSADEGRVIAPAEIRQRAQVRTMGGHDLVPTPSWIESRLRK